MEACPNCKNKFKHLAMHWSHNPSCRPKFSEKQKQIVKGLLMSDGSIHSESKNPCFVAEMTNQKYLQYLRKNFVYLSTDVKKKHDSEESAARARRSGFRENAKAENYKDTYVWNTRRHPWLNNLAEWYSSGKKIWPKNLKLKPLVLKHLYVGDGHFENKKNRNYRIDISMSNERKNKSKIKNYFTKVGLPEPDYWCGNNSNKNPRTKARWNAESSKKIIKYMGSPPPGFEYKWPENQR